MSLQKIVCNFRKVLCELCGLEISIFFHWFVHISGITKINLRTLQFVEKKSSKFCHLSPNGPKNAKNFIPMRMLSAA